VLLCAGQLSDATLKQNDYLLCVRQNQLDQRRQRQAHVCGKGHHVCDVLCGVFDPEINLGNFVFIRLNGFL
jgi:hypothetical protein